MNEARTAIFWTMIVALSLILVTIHSRSFGSNQKAKTSGSIAFDAMFLAIVIILSLVPSIGYIAIVPGLSLTLVHIPVLIGAYFFGWKKGILYGAFFGISSWIAATMSPSGFNAFFLYPWVSMPPRILFGFLAGLIFTYVKKKPRMYRNVALIAIISIAMTIVHTALVFASLFIFFPKELGSLFTSTEPVSEAIALTFASFIAVGMSGEAALAGIAVPAIGRAGKRFIR